MSQENVEVVKRFHKAYPARELDAIAETILDAEIEWRASSMFGVLHGPRAVVAHLNDLIASFDDPEIAATDLLDAGEDVIAVLQASGVGRTSRVRVDISFAVVYSLRANRIVLAREFETRAEALKAVGLEE
jgi:ketosteroid isomerase-like protein